jgi:hypothetical protein
MLREADAGAAPPPRRAENASPPAGEAAARGAGETDADTETEARGAGDTVPDAVALRGRSGVPVLPPGVAVPVRENPYEEEE